MSKWYHNDKLVCIILICLLLFGLGGSIYAVVVGKHLLVAFVWIPAVAFAEGVGKLRNGI